MLIKRLGRLLRLLDLGRESLDLDFEFADALTTRLLVVDAAQIFDFGA
jgi:hypothetical protein